MFDCKNITNFVYVTQYFFIKKVTNVYDQSNQQTNVELIDHKINGHSVKNKRSKKIFS